MIQTQNIYHLERRVAQHSDWEEHTDPFDELIVTWNAPRPSKGHYLVSVAIYDQKWSEFLPYAEWGERGQRSFKGKFNTVPFTVFQDTVDSETHKATGFRVKVEAKEGANEDDVVALHAAVAKNEERKIALPTQNTSIGLRVSGLSQLCLGEPFAKRVCSPTSVTAVINYLRKENPVHPLESAARVWDEQFDIFGHWVFNVAYAFTQLDNGWRCWVERLTSFDQIMEQLKQDIPVVVSVKGELPGALMPYDSGHLLAVIGYDAESQQVLCMDPAYQEDTNTLVRYPLEDFMRVWGARRGLAYIFKKAE